MSSQPWQIAKNICFEPSAHAVLVAIDGGYAVTEIEQGRGSFEVGGRDIFRFLQHGSNIIRLKYGVKSFMPLLGHLQAYISDLEESPAVLIQPSGTNDAYKPCVEALEFAARGLDTSNPGSEGKFRLQNVTSDSYWYVIDFDRRLFGVYYGVAVHDNVFSASHTLFSNYNLFYRYQASGSEVPCLVWNIPFDEINGMPEADFMAQCKFRERLNRPL